MDAKDLRIQPVQSERTHDGNINYASSASSIHYDKNKSYHSIGSNSLSKVDVQTSRPCAVIGPDRIVPPATAPDPNIKRAHVVPWSYTRPPDYPHNITDYQPQLTRNISPRQTYQENMPRHVLPHGYAAKLNDNANVTEKNALGTKITKSNLSHEVKYSEVPFNVNPLNSDPKSSRNSELTVNNQNPSLMRTHPVWPPGSNVRLTRPYAAPELYQYPEYANCNVPRALPVMRPHRTGTEEPLHVYPDPYHRGANIRYEPYPVAKDRYQQPRYDYIPNYSNPYAASHFMQKLPPNIPPHPYSGYPQAKYLEKARDPHRDGYQRIPNPQGGHNVAYPNQGLHTNYGSVPGNCVQNKFYTYPAEVNAPSAIPSKPPYMQNKPYAPHENFYPSESPRSHQMKPQMMMPGYLPLHMQPLPSYPYYRKDSSMLPVKNYDYSQIKNIDPYSNQLSRVTPQFSPNIISPVESTTSSDANHAFAISPEDCGYVSQSSSASVRSSDSAMNYYRALENRYCHMQRALAASRNEDAKNEVRKDNAGLNIRQFLSKWSDGDDEYSTSGNGCKEIIQTIITDPNKIQTDQDQLVVLDLVNVSNEDLGKYEHIQKVSKLPDNIKGYTSIDLLNQFEEVTRPRPPEKKEMQAKTAAFVHNITKTLPNRPLSPLDVEAKISQSIIHKDVGCNFEIKPCSPKMMNVDLAAPARTLLEERMIEKVSNSINETIPNTDNIAPTIDDQINNYNAIKIKNQRKSVNRRQENIANNPSCKMVQTPYSSKPIESEKSNYSLQDLESNSGVCFASLPRLDNDIELSFPEVNQQFINDNKVEPITANTDYKILLSSNKCGSDNSSPTENDVPRLSKYRKLKSNPEYIDTVTQANAQLTRKDSVIIKNPENQNFADEKSVLTINNIAENTKQSSLNIEYLPINLAMSNTININASTVSNQGVTDITTQDETCTLNREFIESNAINLSQLKQLNSSASDGGLSSSLKKNKSCDKPALAIPNDVTRVILDEPESSNEIDRNQCEIRPRISDSVKKYPLLDHKSKTECSSDKRNDSEQTIVTSENMKQKENRIEYTTSNSKNNERSIIKTKQENDNGHSSYVSMKCYDDSFVKPIEQTVPLVSSSSPTHLTSNISDGSDFHSKEPKFDTETDTLDDIKGCPYLNPNLTDSVLNKNLQDAKEKSCRAQDTNMMTIETKEYNNGNDSVLLKSIDSAFVHNEDHDTTESICSNQSAESITAEFKPSDNEIVKSVNNCILDEEHLSSVRLTKNVERVVNEIDIDPEIFKSDDANYVSKVDRIQDIKEINSESVIADPAANGIDSDTKVIRLDESRFIQNKVEDRNHLNVKIICNVKTQESINAESTSTETDNDSQIISSDDFGRESCKDVENNILCDPESMITSPQTSVTDIKIDTEIIKSYETAKPTANKHENDNGVVMSGGSICVLREDVNSNIFTCNLSPENTATETTTDDNDIKSHDSHVLNADEQDNKEAKALVDNVSVTDLVNGMIMSDHLDCNLKEDRLNTNVSVCENKDTTPSVEHEADDIHNNSNIVRLGDSGTKHIFEDQGSKSMSAKPTLDVAISIGKPGNIQKEDLGYDQISSTVALDSSGVIGKLDKSENSETVTKEYTAIELNNTKFHSNCELTYQQEAKEKTFVDEDINLARNEIGKVTTNFKENLSCELDATFLDKEHTKNETKMTLEDLGTSLGPTYSIKNTATNSTCKEKLSENIHEKQKATKDIKKSMVSIDKQSNKVPTDDTTINEPSHMVYSPGDLTVIEKFTLNDQSQKKDDKETTEKLKAPNIQSPTFIENNNDQVGKLPILPNCSEKVFFHSPDNSSRDSDEHLKSKINESLVTDEILPQTYGHMPSSDDDYDTEMKEKFFAEGPDVFDSSACKTNDIADKYVQQRSSHCFYKRMYCPIFQKLYNFQEGSCCKTLESISKISKLANYIEDIAIGVIDDISSDYVVNEIDLIPIGIPDEEVYQNIKNIHYALLDKTNEDSLENYKTIEFMQKHAVRGIATTDDSKVENNITDNSKINYLFCTSKSELNHDIAQIPEVTTIINEECTSKNLLKENTSECHETLENATNKSNLIDFSKNKKGVENSLEVQLTDVDFAPSRKLKRSQSESSLCTYRNITKDRLNETCNEITSLQCPMKRKKTETHLNEENLIPNSDPTSLNYCSFLHNRRNSVSTLYHDEDVSFCILINNDCIITQEEYENETNCLEDIQEESVHDIDENSIVQNIEEFDAENIHYHATEELVPDPFSVECIVEKDAENWVEVACVETVVSDDIIEDEGDLPVDNSYSPDYVDTVQSEMSEFDVYSKHTDKLKNIYGDDMCSNNMNLIKTLYSTPQMNVNKTLHCKEALLECAKQYECSMSIENTDVTLSNSIENQMLCLHDSKEDDLIFDTDECGQDSFQVLGLSLSSEIPQAEDDAVNSHASHVDKQLCDEPSSTYPQYKRSSSSPEVSSTTTEEKKSSILLKITNHNGSRTSHINNIAADSKKIRCKFTENTDYSSCKSLTPRPLITKGAQKYIPPLKETIRDLKVKLFLPQHRLRGLKYLKLTKEDTKMNNLTNQSQNNLKPSLGKKKAKPNFEDDLKSIDEIYTKKIKDKSKGTVPKVIIKKTDNGSHYTSISDNESFNPDMTGRKWQPWVFLEKNKFVDKMASRGKTKAVYCHRKNCYVLAENFKKYKASCGTKFVISQPSSKDVTPAPLRYTIKFKQSY